MDLTWPPLWSSGQSSWLQIHRSMLRFPSLPDFLGLKQGPVNLVSKIEELLGRNSSGFGLERREYGREDPLGWPRDTLYQQKFPLTSLTSCDLAVGIVRSRTKATKFSFFMVLTLENFSKFRSWRRNSHNRYFGLLYRRRLEIRRRNCTTCLTRGPTL
jgi:hypothetical protein